MIVNIKPIFYKFIENHGFDGLKIYNDKNDDIFNIYYHDVFLYSIIITLCDNNEILMILSDNGRNISYSQIKYTIDAVNDVLENNFLEYIENMINTVKLDMNVFYNIIEDDMAEFNFEEAHNIMIKLNHTWYRDDETVYIPSVTEIMQTVKNRIIYAYEYMVKNKVNIYETSSGGFRILSRHTDEDGYWSNICYAPVETIR